MSTAYERETQNNHRLEDLANKLTSLRHVTSDIERDASHDQTIDSTLDMFSQLSSSVRHSSKRLGLMIQRAPSMTKAVFIVIVGFFILYSLYSWIL